MRVIFYKMLLLIALLFVGGSLLYGEESDPEITALAQNYTYGGATTSEASSKVQPVVESNQEVVRMQVEANVRYVEITAMLYAFSLVIIMVFMWDKKHQSKDIVTMVGMASVIFGTILLVLMVGDTGQLTAPMGILGAIAGYLFGASDKSKVVEG